MWKNVEHSVVFTRVIQCLSTSCKGVRKTLNQSHVNIDMEKSAWKHHIKQQFKRANFELISPSIQKWQHMYENLKISPNSLIHHQTTLEHT